MDSNGQRIDNFLFKTLKGVPKTHLYRMMRRGEVRVNKGRVDVSYRLKEGDIIRIPPVRVSPPKEEPSAKALHGAKNLLKEVLYEDDGFLVLNKPSGMAVHAGSGVRHGLIESLRALKPAFKNLELVHRIDRDTSGCLMVAKRSPMLRVLQDHLQSGKIEKVYLVLVMGFWPTGAEGRVINVPLAKNVLKSNERMVEVRKDGHSAITEFKVLERFKKATLEATLLEARPITGRTHQIRVHAQYVGHPVAGDPKYGDEDFNRLMKSFGLKRLFLHANRLVIPASEKIGSEKRGKLLINVEAPLEPSLEQVLIALRNT